MQALEKIPTLWIAANNLAVLLGENKNTRTDLELALKFAKRAQSLKPDEAEINDTLGWIYYKLNKSKQAHLLIKKALTASPDNPAINYHMGILLYDLGKVKEARDKLAKAIDSGEDFHGRDEARKIIELL